MKRKMIIYTLICVLLCSSLLCSASAEAATVDVYTAEPTFFTQDAIEAFTTHCGVELKSMEVLSGNYGENGYRWQCSQDYSIHYLTYFKDDTGYPYQHFQFSCPKLRTYMEYSIYDGEYFYLTNAPYRTAGMFTTPKDLGFATAAEAETDVREALSLLGLPELMLLRTLYLDHETLEEAMHHVATDPNFASIKDPDASNNGYPLKEDWSEEDDAYLFSFAIPAGDIPISYCYEQINDCNFPCEVNIWYNSDGIIGASILTPWTVGKKTGEALTIIPKEQAIHTVESLFPTPGKNDQQIEDARLLYRYYPKDGSWILLPVWAVRDSFTYDQAQGRFGDFHFIDAVTGEIIIGE